MEEVEALPVQDPDYVNPNKMKCRLPSPLICISITTQRRKMRFTTLHCWKGGRIYFTLVITRPVTKGGPKGAVPLAKSE
jgi:hypothetical protein